MKPEKVDLFVIGGGSAGVRAARRAAACGARVALAEERLLGGTCVNVGCIPKKLMVYASHYPQEVADAAGFGWTSAEPSFSWPTFRARKDAEIARLNGVYRRLLEEAGVTIVAARARLSGEHTVDTEDRSFHAERILIACGGRPRRPDVPGCELALVSDDVFSLERLPRKMVIVGGGYVAVEFAGVFHGLGAQVTLVHRRERVLRGFDESLRAGLTAAMTARGIGLRLPHLVERVETDPQGLAVHLDGGEILRCDTLLQAVGRDPATTGLGLETAGVALAEDGSVIVDDLSRTSVAHIYAIGDCTNRMNLTPVAIAEAMAFVATVYEGRPTRVDYATVPTAVFSQPSLATVGATEEQARARGPVTVYESTFRPLRDTLTGRDERTLVKLLVDPESDRVLGAHMLGPDAPEIVQGLAIAIQAGATKADFDRTVGIHPTSAEEWVTLGGGRAG